MILQFRMRESVSTMKHWMRWKRCGKALYQALTSQWAAQQQREAEIAALAHDLKTPLTLAGGNAELLLEEELPQDYERLIRKNFGGNCSGEGVCRKSSGDFVGKRRKHLRKCSWGEWF